jgi:hypothetical protein
LVSLWGAEDRHRFCAIRDRRQAIRIEFEGWQFGAIGLHRRRHLGSGFDGRGDYAPGQLVEIGQQRITVMAANAKLVTTNQRTSPASPIGIRWRLSRSSSE